MTPRDDCTLLVGLDNNYPGGNGRVAGTPDGTELILMRSRVPLHSLQVQPCRRPPTTPGTGPRDPVNDCR